MLNIVTRINAHIRISVSANLSVTMAVTIMILTSFVITGPPLAECRLAENPVM
jgi:hypothetical protein